MQAATTSLVLQLDADAMLEVTFLEKAIWALMCHPEWAFVNSWVQGFGAKNDVWDYGFDRPKDFLTRNQIHPIVLIRRAVDRAIGGHDETIPNRLGEWDYWLRMAAHQYWGGTLPEVLAFVRQHSTDTDRAMRDDSGKRAWFRARLRARYPRLWRGSWSLGRPCLTKSPATSNVELSVRAGGPVGHSLLLIVPWLKLGGADRYNLNVTQQLALHGWSVGIATTEPARHEWHSAFLAHTDDVFHLPSFLTPGAYVDFLVHFIRSRNVQVVMISNSMLAYAALPILRAKCPQTAFVDYHHMVVADWLDGGFARIGARQHALLDLSLCSSHQVRDWLINKGCEPERVKVIRTGQDVVALDRARFDRNAIRQRLAISDDTPVLLYPARFVSQKRPIFALRLLADVRKLTADWVCLVAGDGPQKWLVELMLPVLGLTRHVRLLGSVDPQAMAELYAASDLVLLPSKDEGIALALIEAMSMGLPVVAADVGGQKELVTPAAGILIQPGPSERNSYAAALGMLITSPEMWAEIGRVARSQVCTEFEMSNTIRDLELAFDLAREVCGRRSPSQVESATLLTLELALERAIHSGDLGDRFAESTSVHAMQTELRSRSGRSTITRLARRWLRPVHRFLKANGIELSPGLLQRLRAW
jgi:glycosyltransferase involved in cell wall biosynthesis